MLERNVKHNEINSNFLVEITFETIGVRDEAKTNPREFSA
jgi:hypothetical protein